MNFSVKLNLKFVKAIVSTFFRQIDLKSSLVKR